LFEANLSALALILTFFIPNFA